MTQKLTLSQLSSLLFRGCDVLRGNMEASGTFFFPEEARWPKIRHLKTNVGTDLPAFYGLIWASEMAVAQATGHRLSQSADPRATEARRWSGNRPGDPPTDRDALGA
jgi:hypothetical protein